MAADGSPIPSLSFDVPGFAALVRARRDVRHFRPDPLDEAEVEELLALAHCAPSVGLSQPWRFVRIFAPHLREGLAAHVDGQSALAGKAYEGDRETLYRGLKLHGLREAPVIFAVYCDEATTAGHGLGAMTMPEARRYSCVMAVHTLWLAACARDIGMGWVSIIDSIAVDAMLEVPDEWRCLGLLCLGHALVQEDRPELERRGWEKRSDWRSALITR